MGQITHYPLLVFGVSLLVLWLSAQLGFHYRGKHLWVDDEARDDFGRILGASLTLSGLIIAFSFSMATDRYNQRKNLEADEANAIGTEYVRADLLPPLVAQQVRSLLLQYLDERIKFYARDDLRESGEINTNTIRLQNALWATVVDSSLKQPNPVNALVLSGMNDVLNSQAYTQASYWNRIPTSAWIMTIGIALGANFLIGYGSGSIKAPKLLFILPIMASVAFMLISDIDAPRHGIIRVQPMNLKFLGESLRPSA